MSPKDAIQILDQAVAQLSATRETHQVIAQAMTVLQGLVTEKDSQESK